MSTLEIVIAAPFTLGALVARVDLAGQAASEVIVLREGRFRGEVSGTPLRLRLTTEPAPAGDAGAAPEARRDGAESAPVEATTLYEDGVAIPPDGRLDLRIVWAAHCHEPSHGGGEGKRFGSYEHMMCAEFVGLDDKRKPLRFGATTAPNAATLFDVGGKKLAFGQIIALAGDYYAYLDAAAARDFAWAWPDVTGLTGFLSGDYRATTLVADGAGEVKAILDRIERDKGKAATTLQEIGGFATLGAAGTRRYLALAAENFCHFGAQSTEYRTDDSNEALRLYRAYHERALGQAAAARRRPGADDALRDALVVDAFACHFLTDLFASGHIRVPRRELSEQFGILRGSLHMAKKMHGEDNERGLWCRTLGPAPGARVVWRAYGDDALLTSEAHLAQVQEAVRRSVAEVFAAYASVAVPDAARAEQLLPVPLPPGQGPRTGDHVLGARGAAQGEANHYPLYAAQADGRLVERAGDLYTNEYRPFDGPRKAFALAFA
jgi:hypothetical protein